MTEPLETWIIHLRFLCFYTVIQGTYSSFYCQNPYSHMKCLFTKIQSNIAIWQYIAICSNTIRNMALNRIVSPLIDCIDSVTDSIQSMMRADKDVRIDTRQFIIAYHRRHILSMIMDTAYMMALMLNHRPLLVSHNSEK